MAELFTSEGIPAEHIDGETPKQERTDIMNRFRSGETQILCNMSLISEGVSVDDCSCCILLRPTKSLVLHTQSSMRCMRYAPNKTAVIIDHVGGCFRHGLPDAVHKWDLNAKRIKGTQDTAPLELSIRQCLNCYTVFDAKMNICPSCGAFSRKTQAEIAQEEKAKLEEIKEVRIEAKKKLGSPWKCKSYQEVVDYGEAMGYSAWWPDKQWELMQNSKYGRKAYK
jgi:superfamily II DNA or RNA helicase